MKQSKQRVKMKNLNKLAKQYKETNDPNLLAQLFQLLKQTIKDKSWYLFYRKGFVKKRYEKEIYDERIEDFRKVKRVKTFRLCDIKKIELKDVEQELSLLILELLKRYDSALPFENYLNSKLSFWRPSVIQDANFVKDIDTINESDLVNKDEIPMFESLAKQEPIYPEEVIDYDKMFENLTIIEKMIINILRKNPEFTQQQIADIIGVTQQQIVKYLKKIRRKFIKRL